MFSPTLYENLAQLYLNKIPGVVLKSKGVKSLQTVLLDLLKKSVLINQSGLLKSLRLRLSAQIVIVFRPVKVFNWTLQILIRANVWKNTAKTSKPNQILFGIGPLQHQPPGPHSPMLQEQDIAKAILTYTKPVIGHYEGHCKPIQT